MIESYFLTPVPERIHDFALPGVMNLQCSPEVGG